MFTVHVPSCSMSAWSLIGPRCEDVNIDGVMWTPRCTDGDDARFDRWNKHKSSNQRRALCPLTRL